MLMSKAFEVASRSAAACPIILRATEIHGDLDRDGSARVRTRMQGTQCPLKDKRMATGVALRKCDTTNICRTFGIRPTWERWATQISRGYRWYNGSQRPLTADLRWKRKVTLKRRMWGERARDSRSDVRFERTATRAKEKKRKERKEKCAPL